MSTFEEKVERMLLSELIHRSRNKVRTQLRRYFTEYNLREKEKELKEQDKKEPNGDSTKMNIHNAQQVTKDVNLSTKETEEVDDDELKSTVTKTRGQIMRIRLNEKYEEEYGIDVDCLSQFNHKQKITLYKRLENRFISCPIRKLANRDKSYIKFYMIENNLNSYEHKYGTISIN